LQGLLNRIAKCDRLLAVINIQDAARAGLSPGKVAEASALVALGDGAAAVGRYAGAIAYYRDAWRQALTLQVGVAMNRDGTARLQFVGSYGKSYRIETSTDMAHWLPLATCTADTEGNVEFTDPNSARQPLRFYRAVEQ